MRIVDIGEGYGSIKSLYVNMALADIANVNRSRVAFQNYIAAKFFGAQRAAGGAQGDAGIGGNQYFIVNPAAGIVVAGQ